MPFSLLQAAQHTPSTMARMLEPWAHAYANSKLLATVVTFAHVASLLLGGGLAIATDRGTMRALRLAAEERGRHLVYLSGVHRMVVTGIALSFVTGVLLFASDADTFAASWIFWAKMAAIALLLGNGYAMARAETQLRADAAESSPAWDQLRRAARVSMVLWFAIAFAGVALVNMT